MEFEYNGNLLEDDRIKMVMNEILKKYPHITQEKAKEAALLEGRISREKTAEDELKRLYNIMLVNLDDKLIVSQVFKDYLNVINNINLKEEKYDNYINIAERINGYINGFDDFPFMSDYNF